MANDPQRIRRGTFGDVAELRALQEASIAHSDRASMSVSSGQIEARLARHSWRVYAFQWSRNHDEILNFSERLGVIRIASAQ